MEKTVAENRAALEARFQTISSALNSSSSNNKSRQEKADGEEMRRIETEISEWRRSVEDQLNVSFCAKPHRQSRAPSHLRSTPPRFPASSPCSKKRWNAGNTVT